MFTPWYRAVYVVASIVATIGMFALATIYDELLWLIRIAWIPITVMAVITLAWARGRPARDALTSRRSVC